ncbi:C40 family peptidase [Polymorphobacter fuscus]|uniref:C40 family peptidase n=1 Tax=Sandarakinorhabdus fusca TaxID=1439888 RepID=UPI00169A9099|nr:C40 family peptidase [Polymorphobacter fuscus]NJC09744.1 cell wall-associated NlpC family hydrolase [Polymorphobacter fuscus]
MRRADLRGPRPRLDRRRHIVTADFADIALAGTVASAWYVDPVTMTCIVPRTALRSAGDAAAGAVSELLFGEDFDLFDTVGDWGHGRSAHDHYTGWVPMAALGDKVGTAAHSVTARAAPLFAAADIKAAVLAELPFGARVDGEWQADFLALASGGYLHRRHLAPPPATPIAVAHGFAGAPYLWGGRTPFGIDCSGLVQASLAACGIAAPRDSDQQRDTLGRAVAFADRQGGDLVFFPGHVGILVDADTLFHANAYWMTTRAEPLADVIARLSAAGVAQPVTAVRRL